MKACEKCKEICIPYKSSHTPTPVLSALFLFTFFSSYPIEFVNHSYLHMLHWVLCMQLTIFPTYFMSEEDVRRIDTSFSNNEV